MVQEILYTSAPRGLKPGSQGFCTVVSTSGMAATLAERLESLSGYRHVFAPHEASAFKNPTACSHLRLELGGKQLSVLSRICAAGVDYSGRSNKLAHHVVLDASEQPTGGPAWLLSQPGFMQTQWDGEVRILAQGRRVPSGDAPAGICTKWKETTGDAGWAGVLSQSFLEDPTRVVYIIYEVGTDPLPLMAEAISLLPPSRRWRLTFSTYYTSSGVPQNLSCNWRCILRDSEEAKRARRTRDALVISLVETMALAESGPLVRRARTGIADDPAELTADDVFLGDSARVEIESPRAVTDVSGRSAFAHFAPSEPAKYKIAADKSPYDFEPPPLPDASAQEAAESAASRIGSSQMLLTVKRHAARVSIMAAIIVIAFLAGFLTRPYYDGSRAASESKVAQLPNGSTRKVKTREKENTPQAETIRQLPSTGQSDSANSTQPSAGSTPTDAPESHDTSSKKTDLIEVNSAIPSDTPRRKVDTEKSDSAVLSTQTTGNERAPLESSGNPIETTNEPNSIQGMDRKELRVEYCSLPSNDYSDFSEKESSSALTLNPPLTSQPNHVSLLGAEFIEPGNVVLSPAKSGDRWEIRSGQALIAWLEYKQNSLVLELSKKPEHKNAHQKLRDCLVRVTDASGETRHIALRSTLSLDALSIGEKSEANTDFLWPDKTGSSRKRSPSSDDGVPQRPMTLESCRILKPEKFPADQPRPIGKPAGVGCVKFTLLPEKLDKYAIGKKEQVYLKVELTQQLGKEAPMVKVEFEPRLSDLKSKRDRASQNAFKHNQENAKRPLRDLENELNTLDEDLKLLESKSNADERDARNVKLENLNQQRKHLAKMIELKRELELVEQTVQFVEGLREISVAVEICYAVDGVRVVAARLGSE